MAAVAPRSSMGARAQVDDMSLAKLKGSINVSKFESKYRHKSKFPHSHGHVSPLPTWALVLVIVAGIVILLFIGAFVYYSDQERRRASKTGEPIRWKKVLWSATKIALFLWIPIYIYHAIKNRSWKGSRGNYAEIDEDQQRLTNPAVTKLWKPDQGRVADPESKYEPMGYKSTVYDPYSAYAGVPGTTVSVTGGGIGGGASSPPTRSVSPPSTELHRPPPPHESGGGSGLTPSPRRTSFSSVSQPPPAYAGKE